MIQLKRIIQLRTEGLNKLSISQKLGIHRKTLNDYLFKLEATGKGFKELLQYDESELASLVFKQANTRVPDSRAEVLAKQFSYFSQQLSSPGVTRQLLWEEYKNSHPDAYSYTQFCEHFARYNKRKKVTMHFTHQPGEYLQVDFAGKPMYLTNLQTGELTPCPVLVCVLPSTNYPYIEALPSARQEHLFGGMSRCLEYLGGVPRNILSDNMKQYIQKNEKYEYKFSDLANQWSLYYHTNLEATRPGKPKDKPSVENNVYIGYLRVFARLRNEVFTNLFDMNRRIMELVQQHIRLPFQKMDGSRLERFINEEKPHLRPLPMEPFVIKHITFGKVQLNYHVLLGEDNHRYSVPHQHVGQSTKIIYDEHNVEVFIAYERIAIHKRNYRRGDYTTLNEHMPPGHLKYKETRGWDADYFLGIAKEIGDSSVKVFLRVLSSREFVEQTYLACKGLKRLAEIYGPGRFEKACSRGIKGSRVTYGMIKNILEKNLDQLDDNQRYLPEIPDHANIRGKKAYE